MNLQEIKQIINSNLSDDLKKSEIINSLAKDKNVFDLLIKLVASERKRNKELIENLNVLLSKAHSILEVNEENIFEKQKFIIEEINNFYIENKTVGHCFKNVIKPEIE